MKYITICLSSSMFGGLVTVPSNSPHLRKSGSRPVFSDLGTIKLQAFELWAFCSYNFFSLDGCFFITSNACCWMSFRYWWAGKWCWGRFLAFNRGKWYEGCEYTSEHCSNHAIAYFIMEIQGFISFDILNFF